jgi:ABC-2 type transport system permease protein
MNALNVYPTLIRREFWEHRPLWITPLAVSAFAIFMTLIATVHVSAPGLQISSHFGQGGRSPFITGMAMLIGIHLIVSTIVITFYLLDCLYTERKDRSILFWKSLPVSDRDTVLSKFLVASIVVPLGVYVLAGVSGLVAMTILHVRFEAIPWDVSGWARMYTVFFAGLLGCIVWYAPVTAYLMLISAWARRSVLLWAVLPPVIALLFEAYALESNYVATFLKYRLGMPHGLVSPNDPANPEFGVTLHVVEFLSQPGLWLGLVAAALLLFGAIRIRRLRDDT